MGPAGVLGGPGVGIVTRSLGQTVPEVAVEVLRQQRGCGEQREAERQPQEAARTEAQGLERRTREGESDEAKRGERVSEDRETQSVGVRAPPPRTRGDRDPEHDQDNGQDDQGGADARREGARRDER